jgi:hypothetical protein
MQFSLIGVKKFRQSLKTCHWAGSVFGNSRDSVRLALSIYTATLPLFAPLLYQPIVILTSATFRMQARTHTQPEYKSCD